MAEGVFRRVAEEEGVLDRFEHRLCRPGRLACRPGARHPRASRGAQSRHRYFGPERAASDEHGLRALRPAAGDGRLELRRADRAGARIRARTRCGRFLDFAPNAGTRDVPDPFYGGSEGFDHALDLIEAAARGLLAELLAAEARAARKRRRSILQRIGRLDHVRSAADRIARRIEHEAADGERRGGDAALALEIWPPPRRRARPSTAPASRAA